MGLGFLGPSKPDVKNVIFLPILPSATLPVQPLWLTLNVAVLILDHCTIPNLFGWCLLLLLFVCFNLCCLYTNRDLNNLLFGVAEHCHLQNVNRRASCDGATPGCSKAF